MSGCRKSINASRKVRKRERRKAEPNQDAADLLVSASFFFVDSSFASCLGFDFNVEMLGDHMATASVFMSEANAKKLRKAIDKKVSKIAQVVVYAVYDTFVQNTPFWSGKTIRSYTISRGSPSSINAPDGSRGELGTNKKAIGAEDGRAAALAVAERNKGSTALFQSPYSVFYITNAASLDSWAESELDQGEGGRLHYQLARKIPDFNLATREHGFFRKRIASRETFLKESDFIELARQSISVKFNIKD